MPITGERGKVYSRLWSRVRRAKTPADRAAKLAELRAEFEPVVKISAAERKQHRDEWGRKNIDRVRSNGRKLARTIRLEVLSHYAIDGSVRCVCCSESNLDFLTLDHTNENGRLDKSPNAEKRRSGTGLYKHVRRLGYPAGYQVMCWNCNIGKHRNGGVCPHTLNIPGAIGSVAT